MAAIETVNFTTQSNDVMWCVYSMLMMCLSHTHDVFIHTYNVFINVVMCRYTGCCSDLRVPCALTAVGLHALTHILCPLCHFLVVETVLVNY